MITLARLNYFEDLKKLTPVSNIKESFDHAAGLSIWNGDTNHVTKNWAVYLDAFRRHITESTTLAINHLMGAIYEARYIVKALT